MVVIVEKETRLQWQKLDWSTALENVLDPEWYSGCAIFGWYSSRVPSADVSHRNRTSLLF